MRKKGNLKQVRTQEDIVKPRERFLPGKCSNDVNKFSVAFMVQKLRKFL